MKATPVLVAVGGDRGVPVRSDGFPGGEGAGGEGFGGL